MKFIKFPFFNFKKACPLNYHEKLIYSYLTYRSRLNKLVTEFELRTIMHIHKPIKPALQKLLELNLIDKQNIPQPPTKEQLEWFVLIKKEKEGHWSDKFNKFWHYQLKEKSSITMVQVTILSLAEDFARQDKLISYEGLATILSLTWKTIKASLEKFVELGLAQVNPVIQAGRYEFVKRQSSTRQENFLHEEIECDMKDIKNTYWFKSLKLWKVKVTQESRILKLANRLSEDCGSIGDIWFEGRDVTLNNLANEAYTQTNFEDYDSWIPFFIIKLEKKIKLLENEMRSYLWKKNNNKLPPPTDSLRLEIERDQYNEEQERYRKSQKPPVTQKQIDEYDAYFEKLRQEFVKGSYPSMV